MIKIMYFIRGVPGSGKSVFAKSLHCPYFEADQYFNTKDGYKFDPTMLGAAHADCKWRVENALKNGESRIAVSNTSTTEKEIAPYKELADKYGYLFISLIVENRHGNVSVHGVPEEKLKQMRGRFSIKL